MTTGWSTEAPPVVACLVCGDATAVRMGLMRYRDADEHGNVFASGWRCIDHHACRERYERDNPRERFPLEYGRG